MKTIKLTFRLALAFIFLSILSVSAQKKNKNVTQKEVIEITITEYNETLYEISEKGFQENTFFEHNVHTFEYNCKTYIVHYEKQFTEEEYNSLTSDALLKIPNKKEKNEQGATIGSYYSFDSFSEMYNTKYSVFSNKVYIMNKNIVHYVTTALEEDSKMLKNILEKKSDAVEALSIEKIVEKIASKLDAHFK